MTRRRSLPARVGGSRRKARNVREVVGRSGRVRPRCPRARGGRLAQLGGALFERTRLAGSGAETVCARYAGVEPIVDAGRQCASQNRRRAGAVDAQAPRAPAAVFGARSRASTRASRNASDSAWKIFGHVVARQPLLDLHARLDELRAAVAMSGAFGGDASAASLANAEQAVAETLRTNQNALRRSQGSDWYQGIQNDVVSLVPLRTAFVRSRVPANRRARCVRARVEEAGRAVARRPCGRVAAAGGKRPDVVSVGARAIRQA